MKKSAAILPYAMAVALLIAAAPPAFAEELPTVNGEVKKINQSAQKLTIDHGPIANLDMPSMTMVFKAGDPAMLTKVKPGDKIKFTVDRVNGQMTIVEIKE